jgi:hypothetical protein
MVEKLRKCEGEKIRETEKKSAWVLCVQQRGCKELDLKNTHPPTLRLAKLQKK